jgi:putative transposase
VVIESWWRHFNTVRPHGSLGYKPPAPEVFVPAMTARACSATPTSAAARAGVAAYHALTFELDQP